MHATYDAEQKPLCHGNINASHVLIDASGAALLIGAESTARASTASPRLDVAAVAALLYEQTTC